MQDGARAAGGGGRFFGGGGRRLRPQGHHHGQAVKCPRCDSPNTKFCYYNNYNLSQPRHFCRSCRRYWTKGGVLRNVPVGGGCRKAKRSSAKVKEDVNAPTQPDAASFGDQTTTPLEDAENKTTTSYAAKNDELVITEDKSRDFHQALGGAATTSTVMMTSSDEMMGFDNIVNQTTQYGDEFKTVDYGDPGLFDLTAAVDPSYWSDQPSSLNFLP